MMAHSTMFPRTHFIGFDNLIDELERVASRNHSDTYPPHNIIRVSDTEFDVELAVAGFSRNDLDVEVHDHKVTVSGEQKDSDSRRYVHKGISTKKFIRTFTLHEHARVVAATFLDGILTIKIMIEVPEEMKPRKLTIGSTDQRTLEVDEKKLLNEA